MVLAALPSKIWTLPQRPLSLPIHKAPMGEGPGEVAPSPQDWVYSSPKPVDEALLKAACKHVAN